MNENRRFKIVIICLTIVLTLIPTTIWLSKIPNRKYLKQISKKMNEDQLNLFYLTDSNNHYCELLEPILSDWSKTKHFTYEEINLEKLDKELLEKLFSIPQKLLLPPMLIVTKGGKIIDQYSGYTSEHQLFSFFKKNHLIDQKESLPFIYLDSDNISSFLNKSEKEVLFINQLDQKQSEKAKKELEMISKNSSIPFYYLEIEDLNDDDYQKIVNLIGENEPPILIIIQKGSIISKESKIEKFASFISQIKE